MKILILGAGNAQIDAIEYCKNNKHEVYGCSYSNLDPGVKLFDHFKQIDIKDIEGIKKYINEEGIEVVYSVGSDLAVPTVMKVSEDLGLKHFISSRTAEICQNKSLMREALGESFIGNAKYIVCKTLDEALRYTEFPGMMKPVDSQGQRGCYKVSDKNDINNYFYKSLENSTSGNVIIEKYVDGPEISVNAFVINGILKFCLVSDRITFEEYPGGIIKEHLLPTKYVEYENKIVDLVKRTIKKLNINNGPVYFQMKLDKKEPIIIEVTPRLDGCHMWRLIKHYCNVDLLDASFKHLLFGQGIDFNGEIKIKKTKLAFMCAETNKIFNRDNYDISDAVYYNWYYNTGDKVKKLNGYMEKGGYQIADKW